MTYMPGYIQPESNTPTEPQTQTDASLLSEYSHHGINRLIHEHRLSAPEAVYHTRLNAELRIIEQMACSSYFLIVADYVQWAKDNHIATGPGRGSGPCSLTAFALGITSIDPIKYNLPFERFLNPQRTMLPDFDLEFCSERAHEVSKYLLHKYGADRVAQISADDSTPMPSRLVIGDRPLRELVPVYANPASGFPAVKISMSQVSAVGLVKFNVINQQALTTISCTIGQLAKNGIQQDISTIPMDDAAAYSLLKQGELSNINILDSPRYQSTLRALQPDCFTELCAVVALCHPRLQANIPRYIEQKNSPQSVQHLHPALQNVTGSTYGLLLYQEQLMTLTRQIAGFTMARGDLFRRALQKQDDKALSVYKKHFIEGATDKGLPQKQATAVFESLVLSGQRLYNQSHAIAYATLAYQTAWLKARHLPEYTLACAPTNTQTHPVADRNFS